MDMCRRARRHTSRYTLVGVHVDTLAGARVGELLAHMLTLSIGTCIGVRLGL